MAIEVGSAYISIIPSFKGFASSLQSGLAGEVASAGDRAGTSFGAEFVRGADGKIRDLKGRFVAESTLIGRESGQQLGAGLEREAKGAGGRATGNILGAFRGLGTSMLAAAGIGAGFEMFKSIVDEARESAKVAAITANAIKSTGGAAQVTASQVGDLATAISNKTGADDEAVQSGQNLLLTFTGIQNRAGANNDIFNQASSTLVDMTAAMNNGNVSSENMKSTAIQLGKALNDPTQGLSALQRVGVTFTDQQKEQITAMQKAGDVAGAQKIVLGELNREFGGTAAAASNPMQRLGVVMGNLKEQLGGALLPVVDKFATVLSATVVPYLSNLADEVGPKVGAAFSYIGGVLSSAWTTIGPIVSSAWSVMREAFAGLSGAHASPELVKTLGSVKAIAGDVWKALSDVGGVVKSLFAGAAGGGKFAGDFDKIKAAVMGLVSAYRHEFATIAPIVRQVLDTVVGKFHELQPKIMPILHTVLAVFKDVFEAIMIVVRTVTGVISFLWGAWGKDILRFISVTFDAVVKVLGGAFTVIKGIFDVVLGLLTGHWGRAWIGVKEIFQGVWRAVVGVLQWAWNIIKLAVNAVIDVFKHLWDVLFGHSIIPDMVAGFKLAWGLIRDGWNLLVTTFKVIWETVFRPVFAAIGAVVSWLWSTVFQVVFTLMKAEWNGLVVLFRLLWDTALHPVFTAMAAVVNWLWNSVVAPAWAGMKAAWDLLAAGLKWAWDNVLHPVFDTVASVVHDVAARVGAAFDGIAGFFSTAFSDAKNAIITGWNAIADWVNANVIAKVNDLFHLTIHGLPTASVISNATGGAQHGTAHLARAAGGHVRGPGTSTSDSIPAMLSDGEFVINARAVRAIGLDTLNQLNAAGQLVNVGPGGDAGGVRMRLGFADGGQVEATKAWIRQQAGKPYDMGGVGPGSIDCSGLVGDVWALLSGKPPYRRYFDTSTEGNGFFEPGFGDPHGLNVGWVGGSGGAGHTVGVLDGLYFEATPPRVLVGNTFMRPQDSYFAHKGHLGAAGSQSAWGWLYDHTVADVRSALSSAMSGLAGHLPQLGMLTDVLRGIATSAVGSLSFDDGGLLPQGRWVVQHNASEPDRVLNAAQWDVAERAMDRAGTPAAPVIHVHPRAEHSEADIAAIVSRELAWAMR